MDSHTIYYFHWNKPAFSTDCFERWSNWEFYGSRKNTKDADDDVTRNNLKLFFSSDYPEPKLKIITTILEKLGFQYVTRMKDRIIFQYVDDLCDTCQSAPMSPSSSFFLQQLVDEMIQNATEQSDMEKLKEQRRRIVTVKPNYYEGGYFVKLHGDGWKYHCKSYRDAVYWKRYYEKYYPDCPALVTKATYRFIENDILPGGHWINETDGEEMGGLFYRTPPELIEGDTSKLSISETIDIFNLPPLKEMAMLNFIRINESSERYTFTSRMCTTITYGDIYKANADMCIRCKEHLDKYFTYYPGFYKDVAIEYLVLIGMDEWKVYYKILI